MLQIQVSQCFLFFSLILAPSPAGTPPAALTGEPPGSSAAPDPADPLDHGLTLLRQGYIGDAEKVFERVAASQPNNPAPHYFHALALWWRTRYEENREDLLATFQREAQQAIDLGAGRDDADSLLTAGSAYMLRAEMRAREKSFFKAGADARRGKKALEAALRRSSAAIDACFALGAYNYYADNVSALIKGLRVFLFIPGGNASLGVRQLEKVAARGDRMRLEASLLLAVIYASPKQEKYDLALSHLQRALAQVPASPSAQLALARLLDGTAQEEGAVRTLETFLGSREARRRDYAANLRAEAAMHLARIHIRRARPRQAETVLLDALSGTPGQASRGVLPARSMLLRLEWDLGESQRGAQLAAQWGLAWPPGGAGKPCTLGQLQPLGRLEQEMARRHVDWSEAANEVRRLAGPPPGCDGLASPRLDLALGTAHFLAGDLAGATALLGAAARDEAADGQTLGTARLQMGRIAAIQGRMEAARQWFQLASKTHGYGNRILGRYYLSQPQEMLHGRW
ncbi:MAG: tetratricopeptide repeat protein [Acidobacteriota bacterium]